VNKHSVKSFTAVFYFCLLCLCLQLVFSACASSPASGGSAASRSKPAWVESVDTVYDRGLYVAAVGHASDRETAEKSALTNLAAIFGQSIQSDQAITNTYREAVINGATAGWTDDIAMQNTIETSVSMDNLIGAEVRETWYDGVGTYYAAAVMDRLKTAEIYMNMIRANQAMIGNLIKMNQTEKYTIEGFIRYQFAAVTADVNLTYANVLSAIGFPYPGNLQKGDEYRLEALEIVKAIPVLVQVAKRDDIDRAGRISAAFTKALSDFGFRTSTSGSGSTPYTLRVDFNLSEVQLPNQQNKFVRYEITANFTGSMSGVGQLPSYSISGREGHTSVSEAENRAIMIAERKIVEEYKNLLSEYFSRLLPKR